MPELRRAASSWLRLLHTHAAQSAQPRAHGLSLLQLLLIQLAEFSRLLSHFALVAVRARLVELGVIRLVVRLGFVAVRLVAPRMLSAAQAPADDRLMLPGRRACTKGQAVHEAVQKTEFNCEKGFQLPSSEANCLGFRAEQATGSCSATSCMPMRSESKQCTALSI